MQLVPVTSNRRKKKDPKADPGDKIKQKWMHYTANRDKTLTHLT